MYYNRYGDCLKADYSLDDSVFEVYATSSIEMHETLVCTMTFRAPVGYGTCLRFRTFDINDCGVSLLLYQSTNDHNESWVGSVAVPLFTT